MVDNRLGDELIVEIHVAIATDFLHITPMSDFVELGRHR
jgi:hypothetical protein